ncbi:MAG: hypothetical protein ACKV2T_27895 [Kofleriaceae bacterium]
MDGHRTAELRSLAYHREIARRMVADPDLLKRARAVAEARLAAGVHGAKAWLEVLDAPPSVVAEVLVVEDERMTNLRQMTPFVGVLDARTRWALWRTVR